MVRKERGLIMSALKRLFVLMVLLIPAGPTLLAQEEMPASIGWINTHLLGCYVYNPSELLNRDLGAPEKAWLIVGVRQGSAAEEAGLQRGDLMIGLSPVDLLKNVGVKGRIKVLRNGKELDLPIESRKHDAIKKMMDGLTNPDATPKTLIVDAAGNGDFRTIVAALTRAIAGDTVVVKTGYYRESLIMPNGVTLKGDGKVVLASDTPVMMVGVRGSTLQDLTIMGGKSGSVRVMNSDEITVRACEILDAQNGIQIVQSKNVRVEACSFDGGGKETGVDVQESVVSIKESVVSHFAMGIRILKGSTVAVSGNLLDANDYGLVVLGSSLTAHGNTVSGNGQNTGIFLSESSVELTDNIISGATQGLLVDKGDGTVRSNTIRQNTLGVSIQRTDVSIVGNTISHNQSGGIAFGSWVKGTAPNKTVIKGNTLSCNGGLAISVRHSNPVIANNLIEANYRGIAVTSGSAELRNNTIVLQDWDAIVVGPGASAKILNNIIAFNTSGLKLDVSSDVEQAFNVVHANILGKGFPLYDRNYSRTDILPTQGGESLHVVVLPAYDIKASTDLDLDPLFVKIGSDYRPQASSPLAGRKGHNGEGIGAFPVAPE